MGAYMSTIRRNELVLGSFEYKTKESATTLDFNDVRFGNYARYSSLQRSLLALNC